MHIALKCSAALSLLAFRFGSPGIDRKAIWPTSPSISVHHICAVPGRNPLELELNTGHVGLGN